MFCMLGLGGLNVPNTGEGFQNDENRVWGRFQNAWKNIHRCYTLKQNKIEICFFRVTHQQNTKSLPVH